MADMKSINTEYFSGSQASIFIGEIWVDDILDWQCSVGANAMPLYGYGSTFYDRAIQGRVLVQGSFTINFREPNYLFAILSRARHFDNLTLNKNDPLIQSPLSPLLEKNELKELNYEDKRQMIDFFFNMKNNEGTKVGPVYNMTTDNNTFNKISAEETNRFDIPTFDIKIGYGSTLDENTIGEKILGVKLVGKGKVIMANGEPIKESYNFFARNLI